MNNDELVKLISGSFQEVVTLLKEFGITPDMRTEWGYYNELRNAERDRSYLPFITGDMRRMLLGYLPHGKDVIRAINDKDLEIAINTFLDRHRKNIDEFWNFYEKNLVPKG